MVAVDCFGLTTVPWFGNRSAFVSQLTSFEFMFSFMFFRIKLYLL